MFSFDNEVSRFIVWKQIFVERVHERKISRYDVSKLYSSIVERKVKIFLFPTQNFSFQFSSQQFSSFDHLKMRMKMKKNLKVKSWLWPVSRLQWLFYFQVSRIKIIDTKSCFASAFVVVDRRAYMRIRVLFCFAFQRALNRYTFGIESKDSSLFPWP